MYVYIYIYRYTRVKQMYVTELWNIQNPLATHSLVKLKYNLYIKPNGQALHKVYSSLMKCDQEKGPFHITMLSGDSRQQWCSRKQ